MERIELVREFAGELANRYNVAVDDIKRAAFPVLRHRIITNYHAEADKLTTDDLIQRLIAAI